MLDDDFLSVKILESLWFRTTLLLPNLQKLCRDDYVEANIGSLRLLLSPSLVHLDVRLGDGNHTYVLGFLQCYHTLCPKLKSLRFRHLNHCSHMTTAVSRAITCSSNVETLACGVIDEAALIHIAESRCLKKITATLRLAGYGTPDHPPFENLRVLRLEVQDLSSFIPYLRAHHQPFEEVSLAENLLPAPQVLHEFFTALSSVRRQASLRRIRFHPDYKGTRRDGSSSQLVDFQVLSPLMTFNLYEFDVDLYNLVSLNDDELACLVQAWPGLGTFYFNRRSGWEYRRFRR
ncbi:hypothetical protein J3R82DRAFT_2400 [Butyriboletus roseoflavus]|nr:hypothetical protein J3R82DRAFT_2400 [Butyriboletus roseoflavus]